jgi:hypothetical protein
MSKLDSIERERRGRDALADAQDQLALTDPRPPGLRPRPRCRLRWRLHGVRGADAEAVLVSISRLLPVVCRSRLPASCLGRAHMGGDEGTASPLIGAPTLRMREPAARCRIPGRRTRPHAGSVNREGASMPYDHVSAARPTECRQPRRRGKPRRCLCQRGRTHDDSRAVVEALDRRRVGAGRGGGRAPAAAQAASDEPLATGWATDGTVFATTVDGSGRTSPSGARSRTFMPRPSGA